VGVEVLSNGKTEDDPGLSSLGWVVLALTAAIVGMFLLPSHHEDATQADRQQADRQQAAPGPVSTFAVLPVPGLSESESPLDPRESLNIGRQCPARTDPGGALLVSFELQNFGTDPVTVTSLKPLLALSGLTSAGSITSGGTCAKPGSKGVGGLMYAGDKQLFTLRFRMPKQCPQPFPVQTSIRVRVGEMVAETTAGVYADLGSVSFDACPDPPA
jgi:hypothetical protein